MRRLWRLLLLLLIAPSLCAAQTSISNKQLRSLRPVINVLEFATGGSGTVGSPYTGWDTNITWTANTHYYFASQKFFGYSTSPNFGLNDITLEFGKDAVLDYTGTGNGMTFDAGVASGNITNVRVIGSPVILGSHNASGAGIFLRGIHHSDFDHPRVWGFHNCFETHFAVADVWVHPECSVNTTYINLVAGIPTPVTGMLLSNRGGGELTTTQSIINPVIEGVSGDGIDCVNCVTSVFSGGTAESNNINFHDTGGFRNTIVNVDFESAGSNTDVLVDGGALDRYIDIISGSGNNASVDVKSGSNGNQFVGGQYSGVTVEAGANATDLEQFQYACSNGIFNSGTNTSIVQLKKGCASSALGDYPTIFPQFQIPQSTFANLMACNAQNLGVQFMLTNDGTLCTFGSTATAAAGASTPTERGTAQTNSQAAGATNTVTKPAGVVATDVLLGFCWTQKSPSPTVSLTGWTVVDQSAGCGSGANCFTSLVRVSDGTDGASYAFSFSASANFSQCSVIAYSNVDNSLPVNAHSVAASNAGTSAVATGVTTNVAGAQLVASFTDSDRNISFGTPAGFTSRWTIADGVNGDSANGYDMNQVAAGATGNVSSSGLTNGDHWGAMLVALRPKGAGYLCLVGCDGTGNYLAGY